MLLLNLHCEKDTSDDDIDKGQDPDACGEVGAPAELIVGAVDHPHLHRAGLGWHLALITLK